MRNAKGFTLAEMLAVVGIMLVLMVAAFGVFTQFAERAGPDTAVSTIQAMLNGARDYAAANGVLAAVRFNADPAAKAEEGTMMRLCQKAMGGPAWQDVRGRSAVSLGENLYVCPELPVSLPSMLAVNPSNVNDALDENQVSNWKKSYEAALTGPTGVITQKAAELTNWKTRSFYVVFDPAGGLQPQDASGGSSTDYRVTSGLTIVKMIQTSSSGQYRVLGFALYPLNSMSGTRLVFD